MHSQENPSLIALAASITPRYIYTLLFFHRWNLISISVVFARRYYLENTTYDATKMNTTVWRLRLQHLIVNSAKKLLNERIIENDIKRHADLDSLILLHLQTTLHRTTHHHQ